MKTIVLPLALLIVAIASPLNAQSTAERDGKIVFDKWCMPCHGAEAPKSGAFATGMLPGTLALSVKYQGKVPAVLDQRVDLTPALIKTVVRHGLFGMPITRKTEVSDVDLDNVVVYLTRNKKP